MIGGTGHDVLTGGDGADRFVFTSAAEAGGGANRDSITDFTAGTDQIYFSAFMAGGTFIGNDAFALSGMP